MASGDVVGQVRLLELLGRGFEKVNRRFVNADIIRRNNAGAGTTLLVCVLSGSHSREPVRAGRGVNCKSRQLLNLYSEIRCLANNGADPPD